MNLRFRIGEKHPDGSYLTGDNADAHPKPDDPLYGTICFRTVSDATNLKLMVHELAHLQHYEIDENHRGYGHGQQWWKLYIAMLRGVNPKEYDRERKMYGFP